MEGVNARYERAIYLSEQASVGKRQRTSINVNRVNIKLLLITPCEVSIYASILYRLITTSASLGAGPDTTPWQHRPASQHPHHCSRHADIL